MSPQARDAVVHLSYSRRGHLLGATTLSSWTRHLNAASTNGTLLRSVCHSSTAGYSSVISGESQSSETQASPTGW
jgi:hypothetical protein